MMSVKITLQPLINNSKTTVDNTKKHHYLYWGESKFGKPHSEPTEHTVQGTK